MNMYEYDMYTVYTYYICISTWVKAKNVVTPEGNAALSHLELSWNLLEASGGQAGRRSGRGLGPGNHRKTMGKPWETIGFKQQTCRFDEIDS